MRTLSSSSRRDLLQVLTLLLLVGSTPIASWAQEDAGAGGEPSAAASEEPAAESRAPEGENEGARAAESPKPSLLVRATNVIAAALFFDVAAGHIQVDEVRRDGTPVMDEETGKAKRKTVGIPFLIVVLISGAIFFTFWYRWINVRGFKHAIDVIRGKFDRPEDTGEISHFRALTSALSATVGLGNIAGVAVAIQLGGPGAVFWMLVAAVFGMSAKFSSCTLSQMYRRVNADGTISGGPMYYLDLGLKSKGQGWAPFGKFLGIAYALMIMGGAIGGGNMFQANQTAEAFRSTFSIGKVQLFDVGLNLETEFNNGTISEALRQEFEGNDFRLPGDAAIATVEEGGQWRISEAASDREYLVQKEIRGLVVYKVDPGAGERANWGIGITIAILVGIVILGGIKRIGAATSRIVPGMCGLYVIASLFIIISNISRVPESIGLIFKMAFTGSAFYGGFFGVLIWGFLRASFSNEAGLGSAAIAHAAAKTEEPVREGIVGMIGPFVDTIIVCLMTAMVVIITGAWQDPSIPQSAGITLTTRAFESAIDWFPYVLTGCIGLFAYSTMLAWCYYGERGWIYLLDHLGGVGLKSVIVFRLIFVCFIIVGAVHPLKDVLNFTDVMILSMAFPNIVGSIILAPKVLQKVRDYWERYKAGEFGSGDTPA